MRFIPQNPTRQSSTRTKLVVDQLLLRTEHAGKSGVQLFVGEEMEAYGDQATAASNQFGTGLGRSQAGNPVIATSSVTIGKARQSCLNF